MITLSFQEAVQVLKEKGLTVNFKPGYKYQVVDKANGFQTVVSQQGLVRYAEKSLEVQMKNKGE